MATVFNTSYKVQADVDSEETRLSYNIEEGAYVTTSAGVWTVWNGEWVKLYPHSGTGSGLGWARYDDDQYTSSSKLTVIQNTSVVLPNNGANIYRSYEGIDYYDPSTRKVLGDNPNDVYLFTVVFNASAPNANQTFFRLQLDSIGGTPYERVGEDFGFIRGNNVTHEYHQVFQYYITPDFITSGSNWKIEAFGGSVQVWDIIYFIQKTQSYA
jgi:hypothetical protein